MSSLLRTRELKRFKTLPNHPNPNVTKFKPQRKSIAKKKAMELKQTNSKYLQNSNEVPLFRAKSRGVVGVPTNGDIPRRTSYLCPSQELQENIILKFS